MTTVEFEKTFDCKLKHLDNQFLHETTNKAHNLNMILSFDVENDTMRIAGHEKNIIQIIAHIGVRAGLVIAGY